MPKFALAVANTPRPLTEVNPHWLTLGVLCLGLLLGGAAVQAQSPEKAQLSVSGEAERRVAPDMAQLVLDVLTENLDPAVARREADAITQRALTVLRTHGLAEADINSTGLTISPQYRWLKNENRQSLTGYQVSRTIEARLLDLEQLGSLLEKLSDSGVNRMQPPRLGLQNEEAVYQQVLADAAANARSRAEVLARSLGVNLGSVIFANAQSTPAAAPMRAERAMLAIASDDTTGSVGESYQSGHLTYRVVITAAFGIE